MQNSPWLGVVADDYTGATDLAGMIARTGMRVVQFLGIPPDDLAEVEADCVVVALKSRSTPASEAVDESVQAAQWLKERGVAQLYFKYCSTFDSTDAGNIGPVADALAELTGGDAIPFVPASPEHGRTTYRGHHFVGSQLLSESPLKDHPINPMTDSDLARVLGRQTGTAVSNVFLPDIVAGADAVRTRLSDAAERTFFIADAISDDDLVVIAEATAELPLVSGGASYAAALAARRQEQSAGVRASVVVPEGRALVLAGSGSAATREQLAEHRRSHPFFEIDVYALDRGEDVVGQALAFIAAHADDVPAVVATTSPDEVRRIQSDLGIEHSAALIENAIGQVAAGAVEQGFARVMVAGGETSGAVVNALGIRALRIGGEVAVGVPWTLAVGERPLALLLKSGNFGGPQVFRDALEVADGQHG